LRARPQREPPHHVTVPPWTPRIPPGRDPTPEARARQIIDAALTVAGWIVQDRDDVNVHASPGIAVRETPTATGPADYLLFPDGRACGALEAKPEGTTLLGVVNQGADYTCAAPAGISTRRS
jgi:type I restriction enzyme R subunit